MNTARLKYLVEYQKGKVPKTFSDDASLYPYLSMEYLRCKKGNVQYVEDNGKYLLVEENEVLVLWDGANAGEVMLSKKGYISSTMAIIKPDKKIFHKGFFYYFLKEKEQFFKDMANRTTIPHLNQDAFFNKHYHILPYHLQLTINNYLDSQVKKIKTFITKKQTFIKLLKEQRQSVIDNLLINKRKKVKIKYCVSKIGGGVTPKGGATVYKESGVIFLRSQNVYNDGLRLGNVACISEEIHFSMKGSQVKKNDVLINVTGASIGRCFTYLLDNEANVNQHVTIIRPNLSILYPKFLMLQLQSNRIQHQIDMIEGASREGLTKNDIQNYYLYLPTLKEQSQIITHIKTETSKIDQAISKSEKEIELIQEYQKAMIAEAVLGVVSV